ncbi:nitroreductase family protein [Massilia brevitalea]|uniref:nitroreductase family protein n=1 Tax=Massilia brevitalea TaxID=442526 RepID=UPI002739656F|nr:SagB/ThcOx family dehydrogenase [Massilia brevitalea]
MDTTARQPWDRGIDWDRLAGEGSGLDTRTRLGVAALLDTVRRFAAPCAFQACEPPLLTLSELLWQAAGSSAWGIRGDPAAADGAVDVYVALASGIYRFHPTSLDLEALNARDVRPLLVCPGQGRCAPINLIYVRSATHGGRLPERDAAALAALRTATLFENVSRGCAARGLATAAHGGLDRPTLAAILGLASHQAVVLTQSVGYAAPAIPGPRWGSLEFELMSRRTQ